MTNGNERDLPVVTSVQELTFQMVIDNILTPAGVKMGGFPQEMFINLTDDEQQKWACNICFMVVKDCHECRNKHIFCHSCIVAWMMTSGRNSQRCPLCRCAQTEYTSNAEVDRLVLDKRVKCPHENCWFAAAPLKVFLMHSHGRIDFSNANVDLDHLRIQYQHQHVFGPGMLTAAEEQLPQLARMQILRGRVLAQRIRLVLQLEFVLRHQAITRLSLATDPETRAQAMSEVTQYSEQLNEIGAMLSNILRNDTQAPPPPTAVGLVLHLDRSTDFRVEYFCSPIPDARIKHVIRFSIVHTGSKGIISFSRDADTGAQYVIPRPRDSNTGADDVIPFPCYSNTEAQHATPFPCDSNTGADVITYFPRDCSTGAENAIPFTCDPNTGTDDVVSFPCDSNTGDKHVIPFTRDPNTGTDEAIPFPCDSNTGADVITYFPRDCNTGAENAIPFTCDPNTGTDDVVSFPCDSNTGDKHVIPFTRDPNTGTDEAIPFPCDSNIGAKHVAHFPRDSNTDANNVIPFRRYSNTGADNVISVSQGVGPQHIVFQNIVSSIAGTDTTPSSAVTQQSEEHGTEPVTEHVTAISSSTLQSDNANNVVLPTARDVSTVSATLRRPAEAGSSAAIRQSPDSMGGRPVFMTSHPAVDATIPQTRHTYDMPDIVTTSDTFQPTSDIVSTETSQVTNDSSTRQLTQSPTGASTQYMAGLSRGITPGRQTSRPATGATTRQTLRPPIGATTRRTAQQAATGQPTPPRGRAQGPRSGPIPGQLSHGAPTSLATRENSSTMPSAAVTQQSAEHVTDHVTEHVTENVTEHVIVIPRTILLRLSNLTVSSDSADSVVSPTALPNGITSNETSQPARDTILTETSRLTTDSSTRQLTQSPTGATTQYMAGRQTCRPATSATTRRTVAHPKRPPVPPRGRGPGSRTGPIVRPPAHDASRTTVTREDSDTTPSSTVPQQYAEHVTEHLTEHVTEHVTAISSTTLPRLLNLTVGSSSDDNVVSPTALLERASLFGVTVVPSTSGSPVITPASSSDNIHSSDTTRQSSEQVVETAQVTTGATTRHTVALRSGTTSGRQTYRPAAGATTRRTLGPLSGATTRQTSRKAAILKQAPIKSRVQAVRSGPVARPSAHDGSCSLVTRKNSDATPSSTVSQQSAEHVTEHVAATSSTTLPKQPTVTGGSTDNVTSPTALRERDSFLGVTVTPSTSVGGPSPISRNSLESLPTQVCNSSRDVSADTGSSDVTRQSSEPIYDPTVITASQPAATIPQTSQATPGATTRYTTGLSSGTTSGRQTYRPATGTTIRRTWQPPTGATTRGKSQQAATRQPAPPGGRAQGSRPGPIVNPENSNTAPSSTATQQSAEHVPEHMTEHVTASSTTTLPKQLTSAVTSGSTDNIRSPTAFRERDSLFGVTVAPSTSDAAPSPISRTSLESLPSQVNSGPRHVSTVSATMRRPTDVGFSNATRQPSEPVGGQDEITSSQPAATTPRTSQAITGATTRYTAGLTRGATSGRKTSRPETGATTRRTWQSLTGATTRDTSQQATTRQLAPLPSRTQGPITRPSAHDASTSLVTSENTAPSSTAMQQSAEHVTKPVTEHMTEHVPAISSTTLPRLPSLTVGSDSEHNVVSPTALRERDSLFGVTVASSSSVSRSSSKSPLPHVLSSSRDVSADTATSDATRQSSEPVRGQAVITSSQPAAATPQTSQVTTGATTGHTTGLSSGATSGRQAYRLAAGATTRRTRQQPTGATTRGTSQQATTRQPVPSRGLAQGPRPGLTTRPSAHDASKSLVTRVNSGTTPSTDMQQSAEHVTQHVTEHVAEHVTATSNTTFPRQSSVVSPTALRERDNLCDVTVAPSCSVSRSSSKSPQSQVRRSSRDVSADTATSDVTRQSSKPVGGRAVITTTMTATTPQTSHVTTGATTQYTTELSHDVTSSRQTSRPAIGATTQPIVRSLTGATPARKFPGASTRQVKPPTTGSNRLPTPSRVRAPGPGYATRPPAQRGPNTRNARDTTTTGPGIQTDTTPTNSQSSADHGRMAAEDKTTK
ncbi:hypothetical protein LSAT2_018573 [Lamellibrachia satsuma]|nr:hypothetical protein LSAT2_018573 [Lamellibrachia satsuma]